MQINPDLILRTSTDYMYICYSHDYGESWSNPEPSPLHMTLTTPAFLHLRDGRMTIFNNGVEMLETM